MKKIKRPLTTATVIIMLCLCSGGHAQNEFGNKLAAITDMADKEPLAFIKALRATVTTVVPQNLQAIFRDTLLANLGLGDFDTDVPSDAISKLKTISKILDSTAENSLLLFNDLLQNIEYLEGEGE